MLGGAGRLCVPVRDCSLHLCLFTYHKNASVISRQYAFKCSSACGRCACVRACVHEHLCVRVCNLMVYAVKLELIKGSVKQRECNYQT